MGRGERTRGARAAGAPGDPARARAFSMAGGAAVRAGRRGGVHRVRLTSSAPRVWCSARPRGKTDDPAGEIVVQNSRRMGPMSSMGPSGRPVYRRLGVPADRRVRVPLRLRDRRAGRAVGNVEWLCLPRIDSPSVFGAMLDRDAGGFRLGPADVQVPAARRYLPGTMVLETSWGTPTGWIIVRDVLLIGPWHHDGRPLAHQRRAPTDYDAEHILLRTVRCVNGEVQLSAGLRAACSTTARRSAPWRLHRARLPPGRLPTARRHELQLTLTSDMNIGFEGPRAHRPDADQGGRERASWRCPGAMRAPPRDLRRRLPAAGVDRAPLAALAGARPLPGPPVAHVPGAQRTDAEGPDVCADRRHGGRGHAPRCRRRRAASATGTTATAGSATRPSRCGACTRWASTGRPTTSSYFIAEVAERTSELQVMYGVGGERDADRARRWTT